MTPRDLEFSIAQYADGTLPAEERAALQALLATDERAQATLDAYRRLDAAMAAVRRDAVPAVRWDGLTARISGAVSALPVPAAAAEISEQLEFAVAQYAAGSLPASERGALQAQMAENPALADLLIAYQSIDAGLRGQPLPAVRWDHFASHVSAAVARQATAESELPEQTAFAIAQYADGTLAADHVPAVEAELSANTSARLALADERALNGVFATLRNEPERAVRWGPLAAHLSKAVADEAGRAAGKASAPYRIFGILRAPMRLAMAASVLLAVGLGVRLMRPGTTPVSPGPAQSSGELVVTGPSIEAAPGNTIANVEVGPPPALAGAPAEASGYTDDTTSRPSRIIILAPPGERREDSSGQ